MSHRLSFVVSRSASILGGVLACWSVAACERQPIADSRGAQELATAVTGPSASVSEIAPLPLRIPILAVMMGSINASSYDVFQASASGQNLSASEWLRVGQAAVNLVGDSTLITLPGTGPSDSTWVAAPNWMRLSRDMQEASFAVGAAADKTDRAALTEATARLAQSCQSCHLEFSPRLVTSSPAPEPSVPQH